MGYNLPPGVSASDPHIAGYEEAPELDLGCPCDYIGPMEGYYITATVAVYECPQCESEQEIDLRHDNPFD